MPQSLSKIYLHIVFSTKDRCNLLAKNDLSDIHAYIKGILDNKDCTSICVGGIENHIHILCTLSRKMSPMDLVRDIKSNSSHWLAQKYRTFAWQDGYGVFSVSQSQVDNVKRYIQNQESHHLKMSFEDEYRKLLDLHGISYEEKYMWG